MGRPITQQKRGKGSPTYTAPSHRYRGKISHRQYDEKEKAGTMSGIIIDLLHCPGHGAPLAVVKYEDKELTLIPAPEKIRVSDTVVSGIDAAVHVGNTLPLKKIPEGQDIYNIESVPGDGGKFVRNSGASAKVLAHVGEETIIVLPSRKERRFNSDCRAVIGVIAGGGKGEKPFLKAGKRMFAMRARNKLYPQTSGVAMNAVDHPFGCGRGRHVGKPKTPPRYAPAGRNVGMIHARRTGRRR